MANGITVDDPTYPSDNYFRWYRERTVPYVSNPSRHPVFAEGFQGDSSRTEYLLSFLFLLILDIHFHYSYYFMITTVFTKLFVCPFLYKWMLCRAFTIWHWTLRHYATISIGLISVHSGSLYPGVYSMLGRHGVLHCAFHLYHMTFPAMSTHVVLSALLEM